MALTTEDLKSIKDIFDARFDQVDERFDAVDSTMTSMKNGPAGTISITKTGMTKKNRRKTGNDKA